MKNHLVVAEKLTKEYGGTPVVRDLSFSVEEGEIYGFLGHNGAGKTTTISMLITLLSPTYGSARVGGRDICAESIEVRRLIGYLPEQVNLYGELTVRENLYYFGRLAGLKNPQGRIDEVLDILDFSQWGNTRVAHLSKGMRQRVGIAQAILHEPKILFLDEPGSGLDPQGTREMRELLGMMNKKFGTTIFINTHMLSEVTRICTSIGIIRQGQLIYNGKLEEALAMFPNEKSLEDIYLNIMGKDTADE